MARASTSLILQAPNVHMGGGLALLKRLVSAPGFSARWAQVDCRAREALELPSDMPRYYVEPSVWSRLLAEVRLWRRAGVDTVTLCFHGLPPLFRIRGRVVVFLQNRILVDRESLRDYPLTMQARLWVERWWLKWLCRPGIRLIVQSPTMARYVQKSLGRQVGVTVLPFETAAIDNVSPPERRFDFVYVASGEPHKNHCRLLEAWRLLAEVGLRPSLALTVGLGTELAGHIAEFSLAHDLDITNFGMLPSALIFGLYKSSSALIYPSERESLGLPLLEAERSGLPILAPELDYVRDMVVPAETFDPRSPVSIARAVRRFIGNTEKPQKLYSMDAFVAEVLS